MGTILISSQSKVNKLCLAFQAPRLCGLKKTDQITMLKLSYLRR